MPRYVGRARRKKMMEDSQTIDRLKREAGRGRWRGAREIKPQRAVLCREEKIILIFFEEGSRQLRLF